MLLATEHKVRSSAGYMVSPILENDLLIMGTVGMVVSDAIKHHSMKSTWPKGDPSKWNILQHLFIRLDLLQNNEQGPPATPVHEKTDNVPIYPIYKQWLWILPRALLPLILHRAYMEVYKASFHPCVAYLFYTLFYNHISIECVRKFNRMGQTYGYFDGSHPRDGVPDQHVGKVFFGALGTILCRPLFASFLFYDRNTLPSLSLMLPVQIFVYTIVLESVLSLGKVYGDRETDDNVSTHDSFLFYSYHRAMHEIPWLWRHHRMHHMTKHPNPLLAAFASEEQEWFDIFILPLIASKICPLDFSTWFVATAMITYTESFGHSGVRLYWQAPSTGYILRYFDMELCVEDHDIHHRQGWRKSGSYGKQTRVFDKLFGTTCPRIECTENNIDWTEIAESG